jgi:addiction module RelE/StbE family toxin
MAFKIIWSEEALDDLRTIVLFIAQDNAAVAESFGYQIISKVEALAEFPRIGRVVPEENDELIREIILRPYRIIYKVLDEQKVIAISRIWHGARGQPEIPKRLNI